jgi:hypothetical protein
MGSWGVVSLFKKKEFTMTPEVKQTLGRLVGAIMMQENKRLEQVQTQLIWDNFQTGGSEFGFRFGAHKVSDIGLRHLAHIVLRSLDPSLSERALGMFECIEVVERHTKKLTQAFSIILPRCTTPQDIRDSFPDNFFILCHDLKVIPRNRQEGYLLVLHPSLEKPFKNIAVICDYYEANRLLNII